MENNIENVLFALPTPSHLGRELRAEKKKRKELLFQYVFEKEHTQKFALSNGTVTFAV